MAGDCRRAEDALLRDGKSSDYESHIYSKWGKPLSNFGNIANGSDNSCKVNYGDQEEDSTASITNASLAVADQSVQLDKLVVRRDDRARELDG